MRNRIKERLCAIDRTQADVIHELYEKYGEKVNKSHMSGYIHGVIYGPKCERILKLTDAIIYAWEQEAKKRKKA